MAFENISNNLKRKKFIKLFLAVVAATQAKENGFLFVEEADAKALSAAQPTFVEYNDGVKSDDGKQIAVRATAEGIAAAQTIQPAAATTPKPAAAAVSVVIEKGIPIPEVKRGGANRKQETWPFAQMEVGDSFVVPKTDACPDPAKAYASTVAGATKRRRVPVEGQTETYKKKDGTTATRQKMENTAVFSIRRVAEGARVWRTK